MTVRRSSVALATLGFATIFILSGAGCQNPSREKSWHPVGRYLSPDGKKALTIKHYTFPGPSADYYELHLDKQSDSKLLMTVSGTFSWRLQPVTIIWQSDNKAQVFVVSGNQSTIERTSFEGEGVSLEVIKGQDVLLLPELEKAYAKFGQTKKEWH